MHLEKKLNPKSPKKILTLDGGGIRGIIAIEILAKIEQTLRERADDSTLLLCDYFDFVAGTSTGALIGACVSIGMSVEQIRSFYLEQGKEMFENAGKWNQYKNGHKYHADKLKEILQETFGIETTLGSKRLKTLLLIIMHNTQTDSPWPLSNNPNAKYNNLAKNATKSNLHLPLWQLLRASTAAPTFFEPEVIQIGDKEFSFVDGAITPYNNPAFQAYLMSTLKAYNMGWQTGEKNLLIVSIGTGKAPHLSTKLNKRLDEHAREIPLHLLNAIEYQQDMLCRVFGKCLVGRELDSEIGDLKGENGAGCTDENLFSYLRYNTWLDEKSLTELDLAHLDPKEIQEIDAVENIYHLQEIGQKIAKILVKVEHFEEF